MSETEDIYLLDKALRIQVLVDGFKPGLDSVFLAAACPIEKGESVLDMGCGVGTAGLCVLKRVADTTLTGVDFQSDHIDLATQNADINDLNERAHFLSSDIKEYDAEERFDHVICNPPFLETGAHIVSPSNRKAMALGHLEEDFDISVWIAAGHRNLKSGGSLTLVHRADMMDKIILAMGKKFGAVEIMPLWPKTGRDARRVIIRAIKDRKTPAALYAGITLHEDDGEYTKAAQSILRDMEAIG
ncbi:MAG: methyltransferase [Pseudomonadota bacterium]